MDIPFSCLWSWKIPWREGSSPGYRGETEARSEEGTWTTMGSAELVALGHRWNHEGA